MPDLPGREAYLRRLGFDEPPEPTLATLQVLHERHLAQIPYENLGIMLGRPPSVAPQDSVARVAALGRLGYCFHQNGAAALLLESLGYAVERRHGHVGTTPGLPATPPAEQVSSLNHLVLVVRVSGEAGRWWFDVGLGDGFARPLRLTDGVVRDDAGFSYSIEGLGESGWTFRHDLSGSFAGLVVSDRPSDDAAVELAHQHLSTSPTSSFTQLLVVQRREAEQVVTLRGCLLSRVRTTGRREQELVTFEEWRSALTDVVGLPVSDVPATELRGLFARMLEAHRAWVGSGRRG
ncbi:arylamine N-acetyltransferase [Pedococcus sp. KACC 23699]|uniref:Arylamine N-acetyltransferase n=1 Tax=Pedococcus sp. KACC 23699 TaxID=3149228 RepID=A0AAU7JV25_9MICO